MTTRLLVLAFALLGSAHSEPGPGEDREVELRLGLLATKALAVFRGADAIAANLEAQGMTPCGEATAMRAAIERSLDRAESSMARRDWAAAQRSLDRAAGQLSSYMRRSGMN